MNPEPHKVHLIRDDLENIPHFEVPAGFGFRWFAPGDEAHWLAIQSAADQLNPITPDLFVRQFGTDAQLLSQRQVYLLDSASQAIGTATAWFNDDWARRGSFGRVHWVAIRPEFQGRGLAKPLMTIICERLRALGHQRAYLSTDAARVVAIRLYLKFGFRPVQETPTS